jgi:hypothetical protein
MKEHRRPSRNRWPAELSIVGSALHDPGVPGSDTASMLTHPRVGVAERLISGARRAI